MEDALSYTTVVPGLPGGPLVTTYPISINLIPSSSTRQRPGIPAHTPRRSVQHGTGNPNNPDAMAEARYFVNGAEGNQASVHYCTDDTKAVVVVPLNEVTWQAADGGGPGNMHGFSCEMMEADAIWNDPTRRAKLIFITADLMGRTSARFGVGKPERHWDFNWGECCDSPCDTLCGNRHHCPDQLMSRGLWTSTYVPAWQAARLDELRRMGGQTTTTTTTPPPYAPAHPPKLDTHGRPYAYLDEAANVWLPPKQARWTAVRQTKRLEWADLNSAEVGKPIAKGETITAIYSVANDQGETFLVSKAGSRMIAKDFIG